MRNILVHPGFHKTGTSSMQHFLWVNRDAIAPFVSIMMLRHLKPVVKLCNRFSRTQNPLDLMDFVPAMDAVFAEYPVPTGRDLLISCEGLSGHLPGWPGVDDYSAVPTLASYLAGYLVERFPDAQVRVILTTRDADDWLFSAYRHHLRGQRLTLDRADFVEKYRPAADLDAVVAALAEVLAPLPVLYLPLSVATQHPQGPGAAMVDQMNVPEDVRAGLQPVGRGNEGPIAQMWEQFLSLNRSALSDGEVNNLKSAMAEAINLGGWKKM